MANIALLILCFAFGIVLRAEPPPRAWHPWRGFAFPTIAADTVIALSGADILTLKNINNAPLAGDDFVFV